LGGSGGSTPIFTPAINTGPPDGTPLDFRNLTADPRTVDDPRCLGIADGRVWTDHHS
jgi:hypothetical protein